ncbi:lytic transglycosylase [Sulfurimicrobium lacus]|uniref:Lytic transglycosylase n=1 Tax=Sulfurimicrobium lacus TaxID=2715678 RepID=A0A6F8VEQ7_9PROT|nr:transglycosylase SLT domain-containing protein [Sulfurimicrobium lacus]BCB28303.1 lytic transglycosylase [Sulfurimicrobium lacus]
MFKLIVLVFALLSLSQAGAANRDDDFLAARDAFRTGDAARLNAIAKRLNGDVLAPYLAYYQIQMRLKDASEEEVRSFIASNADSPLSDRLRADWLRILGRQQNWATFQAEYAALASNDDVELACFALQARLQGGDDSIAQDARRKWLSGGELPSSCKPLFDALFAAGKFGVEDAWARIRLALEMGNIGVARQLILGYLPEAQRDSLRNMEKVADNPQQFLDSGSIDTQSRPGRELAMFAVYRLARSSPAAAQPYWERLHARFNGEEQGYVWGQMAFHAARKHDPVALNWFHEAGATPLNELQMTWRVRAALRVQDWHEVLESIAAMPEALQNQGAWRYWKARALKSRGKLGPANGILANLSREHNFYGQLATEELGAVVSNPVSTYQPGADEISAVNAMPSIQRALALYQLNLRTDANREWIWATRSFDDKQLLAAAEIARRNNWLDRAINTADKTRELHDFGLRYPAPHRDVMQVYARERDLDEAWVYGLIRQESRFVQQARSSVGASGLMQLMPATAQWIAKRLGLKHFRQNLIGQLDTNISFGTYYLKYVLDTNDGQPVLATASYNAGPSRAKRWKDEHALEGAIYAESIPFTETRNYVQKVMSNASYYANRFGQQLVTLKQRLGTISGRAGEKECQSRDERSPSCDP